MATQRGLAPTADLYRWRRRSLAGLAAAVFLAASATPVIAVSAPADEPVTHVLDQQIDVIGGNFSLDMQLESADIRNFNLDDDEEEFVRFCFGNSVREILDDGFFVAGYASSARAGATSVKVLDTNNECVLVGFPPGTDLGQYSVAGVDPAVVRDPGGEVNLPDTVALGGANPSRPAGPVLVDVTNLNTTFNRASLIFDEDLDRRGVDPNDFGYFSQTGIAHPADRVVSINDKTIVLEWSDSDGDDVEDAVRFYVEDSAILSRQGLPSLTGSLGGDTRAPDLESVDLVSDGRWGFRFDETVVAFDPRGFVLYTHNGDRFEGVTAESDERNTIRVTFADVENLDQLAAYAAVESGAVLSIAPSDFPNSVGSRHLDDGNDFDRRSNFGRDQSFGRTSDLGSSSAPGFGRTDDDLTGGPDLIDVDIDGSQGLVAYTFDHDIGDRATLEADRFFLLTPAGELVQGQAVDRVQRDIVLVRFGEVLTEDALAAGVLDEAVIDEIGNANIIRTILDPGARGFSSSRGGTLPGGFDGP